LEQGIKRRLVLIKAYNFISISPTLKLIKKNLFVIFTPGKQVRITDEACALKENDQPG
jgi:hypothetical protein